MGLYGNINGAKKIITPLYANINGARRQLSHLYANIAGVKKNILQVQYAWKRYKATNWNQVQGSWNTYSGEITCSVDSSQTHSVTYGYVSLGGGGVSSISYASYTFSGSDGVFSGISGATCEISEDYNNDTYTINGTDPYGRWTMPMGNRSIFQVSSYHMQVWCKQYNSIGDVIAVETSDNGFSVDVYYYARPSAYSSNYDIVTDAYRYAHPDNAEDYYHDWQTGEYYYYGYKYEYIGQI